MIEAAKLPVPRQLSEALQAGAPRRFYSNPQGNIGRYFVAG